MHIQQYCIMHNEIVKEDRRWTRRMTAIIIIVIIIGFQREHVITHKYVKKTCNDRYWL